MNSVDRLLRNASEALIESVASVMQTSQADPDATLRIRQSTARLAPSWDNIMNDFRIGVRTTAHQRYRRWYGVGKRKHGSAGAGPRKKRRNGPAGLCFYFSFQFHDLTGVQQINLKIPFAQDSNYIGRTISVSVRPPRRHERHRRHRVSSAVLLLRLVR